MNKEDKIKRLMSLLKGNEVEDSSFHISIIDRTSDPIMLYKDNIMEHGIPVTKEELEAYYSGDKVTLEIINKRSQVEK